MPLARNVGNHFLAIRQPHFCHLTQSGVRLLGSARHHLYAHTAPLRTTDQRRRLRFHRHLPASFSDQLINRGHLFFREPAPATVHRSLITDHNGFCRGDKKTRFKPRNKLSYAPDAVSREYRGKIAARKEYFAPRLSFQAKSRSLYFGCKKTLNF